MNPWLDSLSEDWISEPRSSPQTSLNALPAVETSQVNNSRSRIPRFKALHERTKSTESVGLKQSPGTPSRLQRNPASGERPKVLSRTNTASTVDTVQHNIIQHKSPGPSPGKAWGSEDVPEWKRKLVDGNFKYGEQRDLFSSAGLENIFQRPTPPSVRQPKWRLPKDDVIEDIPSSPPIWHSSAAPRIQTPRRTKTPKTNEKKRRSYLKTSERGSPASRSSLDGISSPRVRKGQESGLKNEHGIEKPVENGETPQSTASKQQGRREASVVTNPFEEEDYSKSTVHQNVTATSSPLLNVPKPMENTRRTVSGLEEQRNERISPIFVSRRDLTDGGVDFAALDPSEIQLLQDLGELDLSDKEGNPSFENTQSEQPEYSRPEFGSSQQSDRWANQSLPADLSTGTEQPLRGSIGFVNFRRGGGSNEASFRNRSLSQSSLPSIVLDDASEQEIEGGSEMPTPSHQRLRTSMTDKSTLQPPAPTPPAFSRTPNGSPTRTADGAMRSHPSGSPLKLFGNYDTFTNDRLLRRMSQIEDSVFLDEDEDGEEETVSAVKRPFEHGSMEISENAIEDSDESSEETELPKQPQSQTRPIKSFRGSGFGQGSLDQYQFEQAVSPPWTGGGQQDDSDSRPPLSELKFVSQTQFNFQLDPPPDRSMSEGSSVQGRRLAQKRLSKHRQISKSRRLEQLNKDNAHHRINAIRDSGGKENLRQLDGKRAPATPYKNPTPKRRRTLQESDVIQMRTESEDVHNAQNAHQQMQFAMGSPIEDLLIGNDDTEEILDVISPSEFRRLKAPAPHQQYDGAESILDQDTVAEIRESLGSLLMNDHSSLSQAAEDISNDQRDTVREELTALKTNLNRKMMKDNRRSSVTTQDFLDEAMKIMSFIRAGGRPGSQPFDLQESDFKSSAIEEYSETGDNIRPGSGTSLGELQPQGNSRGPGLRVSRPPDTRILTPVREFDEKEDGSMSEDPFVEDSSKIVSRRSSSSIHREKLPSRTRSASDGESQNFDGHRKRKHSAASTVESSFGHGISKMNSQSSYVSSNPTNTTASSKRSDMRRVIAPNQVSHLIFGQIAGMRFDPLKKAWVKGRQDSAESKRAGNETFVSEGSEEDPLRSIPDLTVDETEELHRIKQARANENRNRGTAADAAHPKSNREPKGSLAEKSTGEKLPAKSRFPSKEDKEIREKQPGSSSGRSTYLHLTSDAPTTSTRATSWGQEEILKMAQKSKKEPTKKPQDFPEMSDSDWEHEFPMDQGRDHFTLKDDKKMPQPEWTFEFSSPIVSQSPEPKAKRPAFWPRNGLSELSIDDSCLDQSPEFGKSTNSQKSQPRRASFGFTPKSSLYRGPARRSSFAGPSFGTRSISRIDEQREVSFCRTPREARNVSFNLTLTTPIPIRSSPGDRSLVPPPTAGNRSHVSFHLAPLPDFTINQADESLQLDVSYVARRCGSLSVKEVEGNYSTAVKELVRHLVDVEPYEPYWDYIRDLDLSGKGLVTLHSLENFCNRIEELDVSNNELGQISGAPATLRTLIARGNYLSGLSSWGHLHNLQYLDISGNNIESLEGFRNLIHLRELRADYNKITKLNGIFEMTGLIKLSVRGNQIKKVDFEGSNLKYLSELDIAENQLTEVNNLHVLPSLVHLNLDDNHLVTFSPDESKPLRHLRALRCSANFLTYINVSAFPYMTKLFLDENCLRRVNGIKKLRSLDVLSVQDQFTRSNIRDTTTTGAGSISAESTSTLQRLDFDPSHFEARKLYLSGNPEPLSSIFPSSESPPLYPSLHLKPSLALFNIQYLDLSSSSLSTLPDNFGRTFANTRVLNLNFNALKDVRPLIGLKRIKKLLLAGNRITRLRQTISILSRFKNTLTKLDMRNNPITMGFYPPSAVAALASQNQLAGTSRRSYSGTCTKSETKKASGQSWPSKNGNSHRTRRASNTKHSRKMIDERLFGVPLYEHIPDEMSDCSSSHTGRDTLSEDDEHGLDSDSTETVVEKEARQYYERLDKDTRLRRDVYEIMLADAFSRPTAEATRRRSSTSSSTSNSGSVSRSKSKSGPQSRDTDDVTTDTTNSARTLLRQVDGFKFSTEQVMSRTKTSLKKEHARLVELGIIPRRSGKAMK